MDTNVINLFCRLFTLITLVILILGAAFKLGHAKAEAQARAKFQLMLDQAQTLHDLDASYDSF